MGKWKVWNGGEVAPADWDGKDVLLRDGDICDSLDVDDWEHVSEPGYSGSDADIVGYNYDEG